MLGEAASSTVMPKTSPMFVAFQRWPGSLWKPMNGGVLAPVHRYGGEGVGGISGPIFPVRVSKTATTNPLLVRFGMTMPLLYSSLPEKQVTAICSGTKGNPSVE